MILTDDRVRQLRRTVTTTCPKCEKAQAMRVIKTTLGLTPVNVLFAKHRNGLFLVCPECNAIYDVEAEVGALVAKDMYRYEKLLTADKLTYLYDLPLNGKPVDEVLDAIDNAVEAEGVVDVE